MDEWADALDAFERRIVEQRDALDVGEAGELPAWVPPPTLGPVPAALEERARHLLAEAQDVEAELAGALAHIGQDLAVVRRLSALSAGAEGAKFIDTAL